MKSPESRTSSFPRTAVLAVMLAGLGACSGALKSSAPAEQIYVLRPAAAVAPAAAPIPGLITVQRPLVQPGLATVRIALTRPGNRLDYFAGSRWGAPLPQVIGALATEALLASGRFELAADGERTGGGARFELQLTVRHFEAEYTSSADTAPQARVAFECLVTTGAPRAVLGRCDAGAVVPAGENRMGAIVEALELASQQALAEVVAQVAAKAQSR